MSFSKSALNACHSKQKWNAVARGTRRAVKDSKVEPLLCGHWSPWACLATWLNSIPCCPGLEQLGPAAPRAGVKASSSWAAGWSVWEAQQEAVVVSQLTNLEPWLSCFCGDAGWRSLPALFFPQLPLPTTESALLSSLYIQTESKSWGNQKYIADVLSRLQTARQGGSWSPTKNVALFHCELHEGNSQPTTWWILCLSEDAMTANSPECLRSADKPHKHFIFPWSAFILHFTHKYMGNLEPQTWMHSTSQCTVKNIYSPKA